MVHGRPLLQLREQGAAAAAGSREDRLLDRESGQWRKAIRSAEDGTRSSTRRGRCRPWPETAIAIAVSKSSRATATSSSRDRADRPAGRLRPDRIADGRWHGPPWRSQNLRHEGVAAGRRMERPRRSRYPQRDRRPQLHGGGTCSRRQPGAVARSPTAGGAARRVTPRRRKWDEHPWRGVGPAAQVAQRVERRLIGQWASSTIRTVQRGRSWSSIAEELDPRLVLNDRRRDRGIVGRPERLGVRSGSQLPQRIQSAPGTNSRTRLVLPTPAHRAARPPRTGACLWECAARQVALRVRSAPR
jgi:hypothetical protein